MTQNNYNGLFLPGFKKHYMKEPMNDFFKDIDYVKLDHVGIPQPKQHMKPVCDYYFKVFDFHHFWSADDRIVASHESSLRTTVVSDFDEQVKMPVFEPAPGIMKSQIQVEYVYQGIYRVQRRRRRSARRSFDERHHQHGGCPASRS